MELGLNFLKKEFSKYKATEIEARSKNTKALNYYVINHIENIISK